MLDVTAANASLLQTYEAAWPAVTELIEATPGASGVHLVHVPDGLANVPLRVAIVGQQTADEEPGAGRSLQEQLGRYPSDGFVSHKRGTPFWVAARKLVDALVGQKDASFLWTNLVAVDVNAKQPPEGVRDAIREAFPDKSLLRHVLDAVQPEVVVFFTGPDEFYVEEMRHQFPGLTLHEIEGHTPNSLVRVAHSDLPAASFRSYHPGFLNRKKKLDETVKVIVDAARDARSGSAE